MCKKLKEIQALKPEDLARMISSIPVDVAGILKKLKIDYYEVDFDSLQRALPIYNSKIFSMASAEGDDLYICVSHSGTEAEKRFTLAHEFGHCYLHMRDDKFSSASSFHLELKTVPDAYCEPGKRVMTISNEKEEDADAFARDLLVPTQLLIKVIEKSEKISSQQLAAVFSIPVPQMKKKLVDLYNMCESEA